MNINLVGENIFSLKIGDGMDLVSSSSPLRAIETSMGCLNVEPCLRIPGFGIPVSQLLIYTDRLCSQDTFNATRIHNIQLY